MEKIQVRAQGEDSHLKAKKLGLERNLQHLSLVLPASRISIAEAPGLWHYVMAVLAKSSIMHGHLPWKQNIRWEERNRGGKYQPFSFTNTLPYANC